MQHRDLLPPGFELPGVVADFGTQLRWRKVAASAQVPVHLEACLLDLLRLDVLRSGDLYTAHVCEGVLSHSSRLAKSSKEAKALAEAMAARLLLSALLELNPVTLTAVLSDNELRYFRNLFDAAALERKSTRCAGCPRCDESKRHIRLPRDVRGDAHYEGSPSSRIAPAGEYVARLNPQGAVSIVCPDGRGLGLRPGEFEFVFSVPHPSQWCEGG